jgi:hypothetical protein
MADVTYRNAAVDSVIETAISSLLTTFSTNKVSDISAVMDRTAALRYLSQRILYKNRTSRIRPRTAQTN